MALTGTDRGINEDINSGNTGVYSPDATIEVGSLAVFVLAYDNNGASGADPYTGISDTAGNTWTSRMNALYDPGAAAAGVTLRIFTCLVSTPITTFINVTVTFNAAVVAKVGAWHEVTGSVGVPTYSTGAAGVGAATATPTITTTSLTSGSMVIGAGSSESLNTWVGDADTTNGTWSTQMAAFGGTGTAVSSIALTTQRKVVTATATQTYNPTLTAADRILGWISITEVAASTARRFGLLGVG